MRLAYRDGAARFTPPSLSKVVSSLLKWRETVRVDLSLVILTGLSGSGKTTALHVLEDIGYFCIDNLPVTLLEKLLELCSSSSAEISRIALVIDVRSGLSLKELPAQIEKARQLGVRISVLYLDCANEVLVRRYTETRRPHPLSPDGSLAEGISKERQALSSVFSIADIVVDTTALDVADLRAALRDRFAGASIDSPMDLRLISFGYKFGIPFDSDVLLDARPLPNPFYMADLKALTGADEKVRSYLSSFEESRQLVDIACRLIEYSVPLYRRIGKTYLIVAVGCTGGRHRSVAVVREIADRIRETDLRIKIFDRDVARN